MGVAACSSPVKPDFERKIERLEAVVVGVGGVDVLGFQRD